jgi:hypothetical protein
MTKTMNKTNLQQIMKAITPSSAVTYRKGLAEVLDVFACIVKVHVLLTIATIDFYKTLRIVLSIRYTNKWDYNYSLNGIFVQCYSTARRLTHHWSWQWGLAWILPCLAIHSSPWWDSIGAFRIVEPDYQPRTPLRHRRNSC